MERTDLDGAATDLVIIAPYSSQWPASFRELAEPIRVALGEVALRIDHIGSTSVPGLAAKPVIDIQISVASFDPLDAFRLPLEDLGYVYRSDNPERTKRYFREPPGAPRTHIHVRRAGSWNEQFALLFRDFLHAYPRVATEYARLKQELAERYREDRHGYTDAKAPFIWATMVQADEWAGRTGWTPGLPDA
ncbi:MAG: GrpB family protein [Chloroflexota bacterium]|nr:GrpB family protein [Chloroflexota bacterium]